MAFAEERLVSLRGSPSYLCNNLELLSTEEERTGEEINVFTVVHKAEVELVRDGCSAEGQTQNRRVPSRADSKEEDPAIITQAKWCILSGGRLLLVLATYTGFQIFSHSGETLLLNFKLEPFPYPGPDGHFCRGIASHGNQIFIGTSHGTVLVLTEVTVSGELSSPNPPSPVCDVKCSESGHVVVSDEGGLINLWQPNHQENIVFGWKGVPCTAIGVHRDVLVTGFSSGHVRLYSMSEGSLMVEIVAHAQTVMALDVDILSGKLLTVSEDCTLAIWQLPKESKGQVSHIFSHQVPNKQLCGAKFLGNENSFVVAAYDWNDLIVYKRTDCTR